MMPVVGIIVGVGLIMLIAERFFPGRKFPERKYWWLRALTLNSVQALMVLLAALSWDRWFDQYRIFDLGGWAVIPAALLGYLATTFVFYWWHRARHEVPWLWRHLHQLHHSPARLEVLTSFYKHPVEMLLNSLLTSFLMIVLLGLSPEAVALTTLLLGLAEFFYHWNVHTPYWLGFLIQRPESHCVHHQQGYHRNNYSDLPIWDMFFGTFENPRGRHFVCGFSAEKELAMRDMLLPKNTSALLVATGLTLVGCLTMLGDLTQNATLKGLGLATQASPAPKVFTAQQGFETFSARFVIDWQDRQGQTQQLQLDRHNYAGFEGPYNRRNAYGAAIAYGPVLNADVRTRGMLNDVSHYAFCRPNGVLEELGVRDRDTAAPVRVSLLPTQEGLDLRRWQLAYTVNCGQLENTKGDTHEHI